MFPKKGNKLHLQGQQSEVEVGFAQAVAVALRHELGSTHQAIKTVMYWTGASDRTVKHWFAGTHGPSGAHLMQLMRSSDEVLRTVLRLSDRRSSLPGARAVELRRHLAAAMECLDAED
jgi:hypothetical protein